MRSPLTPQEWETLSVYLDGQLTAAEKRQVQDKIALRPELVQGLEELRRTQAVLRAAPRRRAPRNFTLSAAMAQKARPRFRWGWTPSFSFASAMAAVLLVLSFFFRLTPAPLSFSAPMAAQAPLMAAQDNAAGSENPPIIIWNDGGRGSGPAVAGVGGGEPSAEKALVPPLDSQAAPQATEPGIETSPGPDQTPARAAAGTPTPSAEPGLSAPLAPQPTAEAAVPGDGSQSGPILGIAPTEERGKMMVPTRAVPDQAGQPAADWWTYVQAALAGVTVVFALAAFFTWRKAQR